MRAGHWTKREDQNREHRAGRQCIAKERQRAVTAGELRGHDSGADHGGKEKCRPQSFRDAALRK
jgi:hypothetical protein